MSPKQASVVIFFLWLSATGEATTRLTHGFIPPPASQISRFGSPSALMRRSGLKDVFPHASQSASPLRMKGDDSEDDDEAARFSWNAFGRRATFAGLTAMLLSAPDWNVSPAAAQEALRSYSQFLDMVEQKKFTTVLFSEEGTRLTAIDIDGNQYVLEGIPNDQNLLKTLRKYKVDFSVQSPEPSPNWVRAIVTFFPWLILGSLLFFTAQMGRGGGQQGGQQSGGGGGGLLGRFGQMNAKFDMKPDTGVNFSQVAGQDEAKQELAEIVTFLKDPSQFTKMGAKIPKGVIMEGPPGTGKTLLAKAVAGEAGVPFFSTSGSQFVEVFVGIGASRVRDLFANAKRVSPCIIFIDEIDAIGRSRASGGFMPQNDEREQTLNQLLAEMDGFTGNQGVVVVAATNRADILDNALLRPGRFDRRVQVNLPDLPARRAILDVYVKGKPMADNVDLDSIAARTTGFSGASLENLMNEAAIFAARKGKELIETDDVDAALDRIMLGSEKTNRALSERVKTLTAYHEAGHALVGAFLPGYDAVQKISIIPRTGGSGGATFYLPAEERLTSGMYSVDYLQNQLAVALGGRAAEDVVYGPEHVTTGASSDLQQVTRIARSMVTQYGMNDKVGQLNVEDAMMRQGMAPFLETSEATKETVDREVRQVVSDAYAKAKQILQDNRLLLDETARRLVESEMLSGEQFSSLVAGYKAAEPNHAIKKTKSNPFAFS